MNTSESNGGCAICRMADVPNRSPHTRTISQVCPRCGTFEITSEANSAWRTLQHKYFPMLSGYVRSRNRNGVEQVRIDVAFIETIPGMRMPSFDERAEAILLCLIEHNPKLGSSLKYSDFSDLLALGYCLDENELGFIINYATHRGWVERPLDWQKNHALTRVLTIAPAGFTKADQLRSDRGRSENGFVAMWFDRTMDDVFAEGLARGIEDARYKPIRVDNVEHAERIDDEIIRQIRAARFVVADYTGHRGGVYYEAGFAHGLGIPVFMTCRKDQMKNLHFDIRQYNCIEWDTPGELAIKLRNRIEAVLGRGPITLGSSIPSA